MEKEKVKPTYGLLSLEKNLKGLKNMSKRELLIYKKTLLNEIANNKKELYHSIVVETLIIGSDVATLYLGQNNFDMLLVVNTVTALALTLTGANIGRTIATHQKLLSEKQLLDSEVKERISKQSINDQNEAENELVKQR